MHLSPVAARILGCLVEKSRTTPDQYPLSLNALVAACNQTTNRWPVVRYDDETVEAGLDELRALELIRREKPHGGRAIKYSEVAQRVVPMGDAELALLAVLLLRGAQTAGELKARAERLSPFPDLASVEDALGRLAHHEDGALVEHLAREPGHKERRWRDVLQSAGAETSIPAPAPAADPGTDVAPVTQTALEDRVAALEAEVTHLRAQIGVLVEALGSRTEH